MSRPYRTLKVKRVAENWIYGELSSSVVVWVKSKRKSVGVREVAIRVQRGEWKPGFTGARHGKVVAVFGGFPNRSHVIGEVPYGLDLEAVEAGERVEVEEETYVSY